jgi:copper transport protein
VSTSPVNQAVLDTSPAEVALRFSESVDPIEPGLRLVDADGADVDIGGVDQSDGGDTMRAAIPEELGDGSYVVAWQAISADSHRIRGAYTFSVGEASATAPGLVDGLFDAEPDGQTDSLLLGIGRFLSYAGIGVVIGSALMAALLTPSLLGTRRVGSILMVAAGVGLVGTLWMIAAQAHLISGSYWSATDVGDTQSGQWWFVRLLAILLLGALIPLRARIAASKMALALTVAVSLVALAIVAAGGHGISGDQAGLGFVATLVHLAAMSIWLGGLVLLACGLPAGRFWETAVRFSPWALGAVVALALSGIANGWRQLGSISGLTDSTYGRWLVVKVLIVIAVVGLAAFSRRTIRAQDDAQSSTVRRSVIVEVAGIALVLMATAGLVNSPPPPSAGQTASASAVVGDRIAQVELEPAVTGGTEMHVYVTSPGGGLDRADEITVTAALPSADLGPLDLDVVTAGPNHVIGTNVNLPVAGLWTFEVTARYGEFDQVVFTVDIPVSD